MDIPLGYEVKGGASTWFQIGLQVKQIFVWIKANSSQWNVKFTTDLLSYVFGQSKADYSLFHMPTRFDF